jgi:hypothetical protein
MLFWKTGPPLKWLGGDNTMADVSDVSLLSVALGGALTILGGIIVSAATILNSWRQESLDRKKLRAAKFEELVSSIYEFNHWLDTKHAYIVFGTEPPPGMSPISKIEGIAAVYFPDFLPKIATMKALSAPFQVWMGQSGIKRIQGDIAHVNDGLDDVYKPYNQGRDDLITALIEFAKKEFQ